MRALICVRKQIIDLVFQPFLDYCSAVKKESSSASSLKVLTSLTHGRVPCIVNCVASAGEIGFASHHIRPRQCIGIQGSHMGPRRGAGRACSDHVGMKYPGGQGAGGKIVVGPVAGASPLGTHIHVQMPNQANAGGGGPRRRRLQGPPGQHQCYTPVQPTASHLAAWQRGSRAYQGVSSTRQEL